MYDIYRQRLKVGRQLRDYRTRSGLSLRALGNLTHLPHSLIVALEAGEKPCGPDVSVKLAHSLQLNSEERRNWLMECANTRQRDKLLQVAQYTEAHLVNSLPVMLELMGLQPNKVKVVNSRYQKADSQLELQAEDGSRFELAMTLKPVASLSA